MEIFMQMVIFDEKPICIPVDIEFMQWFFVSFVYAYFSMKLLRNFRVILPTRKVKYLLKQRPNLIEENNFLIWRYSEFEANFTDYFVF